VQARMYAHKILLSKDAHTLSKHRHGSQSEGGAAHRGRDGQERALPFGGSDLIGSDFYLIFREKADFCIGDELKTHKF
jgi:hypothetical protein